MIKTHHRSCHLCEAMCGLVIETQDEKIVSIKGDKNDPWSEGYICPKGNALQDIHHDPDRLRRPVKRTEAGWEEISWEEAFETTAEAITSIQQKYGNNALGVYWGNPPTHSHGTILTMLPFFDALKTHNRFSAASVDQLPKYMSSYFMFGNQVMFPVSDIDRTDYWLILGGNPVVSNGSISSAPNMRGRIKAIQKRGGQVVVIDPRQTETAQIASQHHFIEPGTDVLLLLSMLHIIFAEGRDNLRHLADFSDRLDQVKAAVQPYPPEKVGPLVGIDAETILRLTREFCDADSAVAYGRLGVCQNPFGAVCTWLLNVLNIVTGNFDRAGGSMFTSPAYDLRQIAKIVTGGGHYNTFQSRVRSLPEFSDELPTATLLEEVITPGEGQIKAMLLLAGNPVLTTPNGSRLDEAMANLEFCVAIDFYITESTRHANIILPPTSPLEHSNYEIAVSNVAVRNIARYSPAVFEKPADAKDDWEIMVELMRRIEKKRGGVERVIAPIKSGFFTGLTPDGIVGLGLRLGQQKTSLKKLKDTPHTVDFGPLEPCLPKALYTPNKRIDLAPSLFINDLERINGHFFSDPKPETKTLKLIGRRHLRSNNSWMHNYHRLVKGPNRCTLLIHPSDAEKRGINHAETVTVSSSIGSIQIEAEVTDTVKAGIVSIPHGWGHDIDGTQWEIAKKHAGASVNDLTDPSLVDGLSGNAVMNGIPVEVSDLPA